MTVVPRVAYQGEAGAFGEAAVIAYWRGAVNPIPAPTFCGALELTCDGRAEFAAIPVWNSSVGPIGEGLHALSEYQDRIDVRDAVVIPVRLCLVGLPGASLETVRTVASHRAALGQCTRFFAEHWQLRPHVADNTARAALELSWLAHPDRRNGSPPWYANLTIDNPQSLGAIASAGAARRYGLDILVEGIQDNPNNSTRFVIVRLAERLAR